MSYWVSALILIGLVFFVAAVLYDVLRALWGWYYWKVIFPREDARESLRAFQEWQREQLRDTPYNVRPGDLTRPDDDDGLSPLVELWRRRR